MNEDKDKLIGAALARGLVQSGARGEAGMDHPDPETIAAVVEGMVQGDERDGILKHISACDTCYDTFLLTAELQKDGESKKEKQKIISFRPLALAASILIVIFSIYVFYRSGDIPKTPAELMEISEAVKMKKAPEPSVDEVTYAKKSAPVEAAAMEMEETQKKETEAKPPVPVPKKGGAPANEFRFRDKGAAKEKREEKKAVWKKGDADVPRGKRVEKGSGKARVADVKDKEELDREPKEYFQKKVQREEVRQELRTDIAEQAAPRPKRKQEAPDRGRTVRFEYPPIQTQAAALNMSVQQIPSYIPQKDIGKIFKETLTLSRQMGKEYETVQKEAKKTGNYSLVDAYVSGLSPLITVKTVGDTPHIAPNIRWFLSRSDPRTMEYRFFALARFGWCDTADLCYDLKKGTPRLMAVKRAEEKEQEEADDPRGLLSQWQELQPGLKGIFKKVAHRTIVNLEKKQRR